MNTVLHRARVAGHVTRALGAGWVAARARHELRVRSGYYRHRLPAVPWDDIPLADSLLDPSLAQPEAYATYRQTAAPPFFFASADRLVASRWLAARDRCGSGPRARSRALAQGRFTYFSYSTADLGMPPDWHRNPFTGEGAPADRHWSEIQEFASGDIKVIWEPSRFSFAFDLVRAYWRDGDDQHAELFWQLLESWRHANPPQVGPNWKCGQEMSLRLIAWCFALYGFIDSPSSTPERLAMLGQMVTQSGHRIAASIDYALSQRNNHGISEGMGLWTIGTLFPELCDAADWRQTGREVLERLGHELIYDDGGFSQHSTNYHRLMLHDYLWCARLAQIQGDPFSAALLDRLDLATNYLHELLDDETGYVPNWGANDGALVLPLSDADYRDFRPVLQCLHYLTVEHRTFADGPWAEDLFWLFGLKACAADIDPRHHRDLRAKTSGCHTLRGDRGFAFLHCPDRFIDRPAHADLLHVDIWWRGINIAQDAGSYSYNAPAPWNEALANTAVHNTVTVDQHDQMQRVGRFLWVPWARGAITADSTSQNQMIAYLEGTHYGYQLPPSPVSHRRGVARLGTEHWLIMDEMQAREVHDYRLQWLLANIPMYRAKPAQDWSGGHVCLPTPHGAYDILLGVSVPDARFTAAQGMVDSTRGWVAPHYLERSPALSVAVECRGAEVFLWTVMGPDVRTVELRGDSIFITTARESMQVARAQRRNSPLLTRLVLEAANCVTTLEITS